MSQSALDRPDVIGAAHGTAPTHAAATEGATVRETLSLDGTWEFIADPERQYVVDTLPQGEPIQVPGCWEAQVARSSRIVTAWYRREFEISPAWDGSLSILRFGAVMYSCTVFLNGRRIGAHEGGYLPFEVDATSAVRTDGPNVLVVRAVNPLNALDDFPAFSVEALQHAEASELDLPLAEAPHGKQTWYTSQSGLWQSVTLQRRPHVSIAAIRMRPDVPAGEATAMWIVDRRPVGEGGVPDALHLVVSDPAGTVVARERIQLASRAAGQERGVVRIAIPDAQLWDIDQPNLYTVTARLVTGDAVVDELPVRFGMREIATRDGQVLLNGRPIYLLGALDQDFYPDTISTPPSRAYLDEQIRLAREMGLNLLRCHIKVPDPAYLDAADEAGILVWCELPNWTRFTTASAARGRAMLERMVETLDNHPSLVIWTIINEDWGTQLRFEARDRRWLRRTFAWLKELDPTRLIVDNSPCNTPSTPNFHLRTDLLDFHFYYLPPDNAVQWRNAVADFARRPNWLWSPQGDAEPQGDEPLILSEFGSWGLPRIDPIFRHYGREPWWFGTGRDYYLPRGIRRRFQQYGLDRIWPSVDALAEATQWHQFEGLHYEIGQVRRHDSIQGYVITEFTDAYWEANGLLDVIRNPKAFHHRLADLNAPDVLVVDLTRRDLCSGGRLRGEVHLSSFGRPAVRGRVDWEVLIGDRVAVSGSLDVEPWPAYGARSLGWIDAEVPDVAEVVDGRLLVRAFDEDGSLRARDEIRVALLPAATRRTTGPLHVAVYDPLEIWEIADRVRALGHTVGPLTPEALLVTAELTDEVLDHLDAGGRALVLVRTKGAVPDRHELTRPLEVHLRRLSHSGWPGQRSPWEGDWVTSWSWLDHAALPGLPQRNPLDFAYEEVLPDHVLLGYDPPRHLDEVSAGMFVGWVHTPAASVWSFRQGRGSVTLTTFRVAPESGPVATALLERLLQVAARSEKLGRRREERRADA